MKDRTERGTVDRVHFDPRFWALPLLGLLACGGNGGAGGPGADADGAADVGAVADAPADMPADVGADFGADAGAGVDIPPGVILFVEPFDDNDFVSRGWYDGPSGAISPASHDGPGALECTFDVGGTSCRDGKPARHAITPSETVYVSLWVRYDDAWVGSGLSYHPHELHFTTNEDSQWVGPANTHLTLYIEHVGGQPRLAMQDSLNVDTGCILRNDDSFVGCGGDFATYPFTESRSAASCNGLAGDWDFRDCFFGGYWYSAKGWEAAQTLTNGEWHFVEAYFGLNSIAGGVGLPDGQVRYALDRQLLISSDGVLLRTGVHDAMRFDHFLMLPYIGDGSPIQQTVLYDELTVATGKP